MIELLDFQDENIIDALATRCPANETKDSIDLELEFENGLQCVSVNKLEVACMAAELGLTVEDLANAKIYLNSLKIENKP